MLASAAMPVASRPSFHPGYGISAGEEGMLDWDWAEERLVAARNYWIATTRADGRPHAVPVWGVWLEGALIFGTNPESVKGRNIARDPRVVAHLESGDEVVILEGTITMLDNAAQLQELERVYSAKYEFDVKLSGAFQLQPDYALAWTESDYPRTATRFDFA
jgi:PPOX class probable F420-dependent enzyme